MRAGNTNLIPRIQIIIMVKSIQPIVFVLIIVGLIIGTGVGYIVSNNPLQQRIAELETQKQELENTLQTKNTNISGLQFNITNTNNEITKLKTQRDEIKTGLTNLLSAQEELQQTVSQLEGEKALLESKILPRAGYTKFRMFNLSFDYPTNWEIDVTGLQGGPALDSYGTALATYNKGERDVGVSWASVPYSEGMIENYWNVTMILMKELYNSTVLSINYTIIDNQQVKTFTIRGTFDGRTQYSMMAAFYSDTAKKLYMLQYNVPTKPELAGYNQFFSSVRIGGVN